MTSSTHTPEDLGTPGALGERRRERLARARLYVCTDSRRERGDLAAFADAALRGGVDLLQLREKGMEAREELAALEVLADACRRHDALLAVNDRADVALAAGADVLHLGQDDLPVATARRILGDDVLIGRSTHDVESGRPPRRPRSARGSRSAGSTTPGSPRCWTRARPGWSSSGRSPTRRTRRRLRGNS
jgi:thiamine-phosphate pyrophosphorylase